MDLLVYSLALFFASWRLSRQTLLVGEVIACFAGITLIGAIEFDDYRFWWLTALGLAAGLGAITGAEMRRRARDREPDTTG